MRRAFTLIELLVVIAIIGVLAALLFPVFSQAKAAAKGAACLSNVKQLGQAHLMYAGDSDDTYVGDEVGSGGAVRYWADLLEPYTHNEKIASCPGAEAAYDEEVPWTYSYALNDVREEDGDHVGAAWAQGSEIKKPSQIVLLVDGWPTSRKPSTQPDREEVSWEVGRRGADLDPLADGNPRHLGGFSIVFCDGHAKRRKRIQTNGHWIGGTSESEWAARKDD